MSESYSSPEGRYFCPSEGRLFGSGESKLGRLVDALALGGDEGRDKLR